MTRSLIPASLLILTACADPVDEPTDADTDAVVDTCVDEDGDGYDPIACGGIDCDDTASAVHPGALERLGDDVDQDCDGNLDLGLLYVLVHDGTLGGPWSFSPDGALFGGLVIHDDRAAESVTVPLAVDVVEPDRSPVAAQDVPLSLSAPAVRLWDRQDPLDVYVVDRGSAGHHIRVLDLGQERVLQQEPGPGPQWFSAAVVGADLHMVECGDHPLTWLRTPVLGGDILQASQTEVGPDRCAVLGTGAVPTLLAGTVAPGPLTRWRVEDAALTDALVMAPGPSLDRLSSIAEDGRALFAFAHEGRIHLFDAAGRGSIEETAGAVRQLAVDVADTGEVALAWTTGDGVAHIAFGDLGSPLRTLQTEGVDPDAAIAVNVTADHLQVAWTVDDTWEIRQALRE